jgi:methylenetetrahydrofolate reductase (NADPH)
MKNFLLQFFTWWNGQTLGTRLYTWRMGEKVGTDEFGNTYYRTRGGAKDPAREGRDICIEIIQEVRAMNGVHGVHVMAYRQEESVAEIIDRSGVLAGRVPWYPGRDREPQRMDIEDEVTP